MPGLPLVSIVAINYNNAPFLEETLDSIAKQDYPNTELIIVDDCSTDNSVELINNWLAGYKGACKFIRHEHNKGVCATCNSGLKNATGKYFSLIATDDAMMPEKTGIQVRLLESSDEKVAGVFSDAWLMDEAGQPMEGRFIQRHRQFDQVPSGNIYDMLLEKNFIPAMTVFLKKEVIDALGGYDETLIYEDYDMWLRIAQKYELVYSDYVSCRYRVRQGSLTFSIKNWGYSNMRIFLKHVGAKLPMSWLHDTAWHAYLADDTDTLLLVKELAAKTNDRALMATYLFWKFRIPLECSQVIITELHRNIAGLSPKLSRPDDNDLDIFVNEVLPSVPRNTLKTAAIEGYRQNIPEIRELITGISRKTKDRYLTVVYLFWKSGITFSQVEIILSDLEQRKEAGIPYTVAGDYDREPLLFINEILPPECYKLLSATAYFENNLLMQPMVKAIYKKTGDKYFKAILALWKFKVNRHAGEIILKRTEDHIAHKRNGFYIDLCIYKDAWSAAKAGHRT